MDEAVAPEVALLLFGGTGVLLLLGGALVAFFLLYQRRLMGQQLAHEAALAKVSKATGGRCGGGAGTTTTTRLYQNLDALRPLLDRLDIRLGLAPATSLTMPAKNFGLKRLRERLAVRDAEAVSQGLTVLHQAIQDNLPALQVRGYGAQELTDLTKLHKAIDADNAQQHTHLNASTTATQGEDADYLALDALLGQVLRTGRLLYKANKPKRQQYVIAALMKRLHAADKPKAA